MRYLLGLFVALFICGCCSTNKFVDNKSDMQRAIEKVNKRAFLFSEILSAHQKELKLNHSIIDIIESETSIFRERCPTCPPPCPPPPPMATGTEPCNPVDDIFSVNDLLVNNSLGIERIQIGNRGTFREIPLKITPLTRNISRVSANISNKDFDHIKFHFSPHKGPQEVLTIKK